MLKMFSKLQVTKTLDIYRDTKKNLNQGWLEEQIGCTFEAGGRITAAAWWENRIGALSNQ